MDHRTLPNLTLKCVHFWCALTAIKTQEHGYSLLADDLTYRRGKGSQKFLIGFLKFPRMALGANIGLG